MRARVGCLFIQIIIFEVGSCCGHHLWQQCWPHRLGFLAVRPHVRPAALESHCEGHERGEILCVLRLRFSGRRNCSLRAARRRTGCRIIFLIGGVNHVLHLVDHCVLLHIRRKRPACRCLNRQWATRRCRFRIYGHGIAIILRARARARAGG